MSSTEEMPTVPATFVLGNTFDFGFASFILLLIFFVLLILAICGAAGYFYYRNKQQKLKQKHFADVESGRGGQQLPLRSHSKHQVDKPRRSLRHGSPSSQSSTESSSDESRSASGKLKVTQSEAYPTRVTSNRNGDKEIEIKGLPTGSLVFVVRNKRSRSHSPPSVKKKFSSTTVVHNSSVKFKKDKKGELAPVSTSASQSTLVSQTPSSVISSVKTPPMKSPPASPSTVSLTQVKKAEKQASKLQNHIDVPKQSIPFSHFSVSPTSALIEAPSENSSVSSVQALSHSNLHSLDSEDSSNLMVSSMSSLQEETPVFSLQDRALVSSVNRSDSSARDLKVSPENWSFKSAFTSCPNILERSVEGEKDIKKTATIWRTNINGNPVEGRTVKYSSRRISVAHPKQVAQALSLSAVVPNSTRAMNGSQDKKSFEAYLPPLSSSERKIQPGSIRHSPDMVDKTQSSSSSGAGSNIRSGWNPFYQMRNVNDR